MFRKLLSSYKFPFHLANPGGFLYSIPRTLHKVYFGWCLGFNPTKGDVSYSQLNARGGHFGPPLEINEVLPWDTILQNVFLKPLRFMITCKNSGPYLKKPLRYWYLKIFRSQYFIIPWPPKIAVTRSIFEIDGSSFGFSPLFLISKNDV